MAISRWLAAITYNSIAAKLLNVYGRIAAQYDPATEQFAETVAWSQRDLGIEETGMVDFETIHALLGDDLRPHVDDSIILNGDRVLINAHVMDFTETKTGGLSFRDFKRGYQSRGKLDDIRRIVLHWDVTLSSEKAFNVLVSRGYASHFGVNYDGVIYQWLDPAKFIAYHIAEDNHHGVGIDVNNPVDIKYMMKCDEQGHLRPVLKKSSFGFKSKEDEFLGFTDAQLASTKELLRVLGESLDIPIVAPMGEHGTYGVVDALNVVKQNGAWIALSQLRGTFGHLNYFYSAKHNGKWDPLGLPWEKVT